MIRPREAGSDACPKPNRLESPSPAGAYLRFALVADLLTGVTVRGGGKEKGKWWRRRSAPERAPGALGWHFHVLSVKGGKDGWKAQRVLRYEGRQVATSPATARTTAHDRGS